MNSSISNNIKMIIKKVVNKNLQQKIQLENFGKEKHIKDNRKSIEK